jgi:Ribonuclease G/E
MPSAEILVAESPGELRLALLLDGALAEYFVHRPGAPDGLGDLHRARVTAVVPSMAGAFLALDGGLDSFLPDSRGAAGLTQGDLVGVRITRTAQGGKGARVTAQLDDAEAREAGEGPMRLVRRGPTPLEELRAAYPQAATRHADVFPDDIAAAVEALASASVSLPGGMRATICPTPALTAIDVDMASATAGNGTKPARQLAANRAAIPALARQIRLRNLSGAILIDFAGLSVARRSGLVGPLTEALAADRQKPRLAGLTSLGFAEILRPRGRPPLHEILATPLAEGLEALRVAAREARSMPERRLALRAPPLVVAALQEDPAALPAYAALSTYPMVLRADPTIAFGNWILEAVRD